MNLIINDVTHLYYFKLWYTCGVPIYPLLLYIRLIYLWHVSNKYNIVKLQTYKVNGNFNEWQIHIDIFTNKNNLGVYRPKLYFIWTDGREKGRKWNIFSFFRKLKNCQNFIDG